MDVLGKIKKLLRLAKGREDEPEGKTALSMAEEMMEEHGISMDEVSAHEDSDKGVEQIWVLDADEPSPWMEMLLVALCDVVYGGVVLPLIGPSGNWRLCVVESEGGLDTKILLTHFHYLKDRISELTEDFSEILVEEGRYTDHRALSFSLGCVYGVTEMLFEDLEGVVPDEAQMPFAYGKALAAAPEEEEPYMGPHHDSFKKQLERSQATFEELLLQPQGAQVPHVDQSEEKAITPEWSYFDQGRKAAHQLIDDPFPDEIERTG